MHTDVTFLKVLVFTIVMQIQYLEHVLTIPTRVQASNECTRNATSSSSFRISGNGWCVSRRALLLHADTTTALRLSESRTEQQKAD